MRGETDARIDAAASSIFEHRTALAERKVDERVLVEILCTKKSDEFKQINESYAARESKLR